MRPRYVGGRYGPGGKYGDPPELRRAAVEPVTAWCYVCQRKGRPAAHSLAGCPLRQPCDDCGRTDGSHDLEVEH